MTLLQSGTNKVRSGDLLFTSIMRERVKIVAQCLTRKRNVLRYCGTYNVCVCVCVSLTLLLCCVCNVTTSVQEKLVPSSLEKTLNLMKLVHPNFPCHMTKRETGMNILT